MLMNILLEAASWGPLAGGLGAGLVVFSAAMGIGKIGASAAEGIARQPESANNIRTTAIIIAVLIEGVALFGAVICFMALSK